MFGRAEGAFSVEAAGEPFIVPLAIPLIAGPSALATVMLMATRDPSRIGMWAGAITVVMAFTTVLLVLAERIKGWMGDKVVKAIERLMGLILTTISIETCSKASRSSSGASEMSKAFTKEGEDSDTDELDLESAEESPWPRAPRTT